MIWPPLRFPDKFPPMRLYLSALVLGLAALLLIGSGSGAWPAEPPGATIVLQLPPSMPPDAVRALLAELAAKGARPTPTRGADPPRAVSPTPATSAGLATDIWANTMEALRSLPLLAAAPQRWAALTAAEGVPRKAAIRFWIMALAGLAAPPLIGQFARRLFDNRRRPVVEPGLMPRLHAGGVTLLIALASLAVFGVAYWAALLFASSGGPVLEQTADHLVWAVLKWRLLIIALAVIVSPYRPDLRLVAIGDADAAIWSRWVAVYLALNPAIVFAIWFVERLGFGQEVVFGAAFAFSLPITAYKIAMYWAIRHPVARAIRAATGVACTRFRRGLASIWHWLFIGLAIVVMVVATIEFALGKGAWVTAAAAATQGVIVVLAIIWQVGQKLIPRLFVPGDAELGVTLRRARFERALLQLFDAFLWIVGAAWLAQTWGLDLIDPAPGSIERLFVRPVLEAAATIVGAWILWTALSAVIDEKMPQAMGPGGEEEAATGQVSRVGTLLPLIRNMVLIGLAVVAIIVALSTLGLNIGPLLAGLGVVGIAVGFGAQTLVRDVISGIFFLMEDAFRVGEYIDAGRLRGTVEGMSLRSVRLRHQNGQIHTIPFGQVQAVTNFSRDWSVVKFNLHLEPTVDIETVRRTVKRVGEELLDDPEIGGEFIQPLKMQGVVDVMQSALVVRCKFTATPNRPTYLQRQALRRLIEAFAAANLHFAAPNVTMQLSPAAG
ncbi:MAG: mechanosensitive ion channel [Alphaproteobacteria bacterium]|nr:mechanosensitive ion channel [Alphaproteobacteria bacterium]